MKNHQPFTRRFNQSVCVFVLTLLLIAASTDAVAAPGDLDPSWGNGGIAVTSFSNLIDYTASTVMHPDGKILEPRRHCDCLRCLRAKSELPR